MEATHYTIACSKDGNTDHITVYAGTQRIGEMAVCRDSECSCSGDWTYWGVGLSGYEITTLPKTRVHYAN